MTDIQIIQSRIYEIRAQRVMLDFDLSMLYGIETRRLNEQVKRNTERFPEDFMFQLTKQELQQLRCEITSSNNWTSQIATSNFAKMGLRKLPYAFTESGVAMLSSVIHSPLAIQVNINIMRAFVQMRHTLVTLNNTQLQIEQMRTELMQLRYDMEDMLREQNDINEDSRAQLDAISTALAELQAKPANMPRQPIGFVKEEEAIYKTKR